MEFVLREFGWWQQQHSLNTATCQLYAVRIERLYEKWFGCYVFVAQDGRQGCLQGFLSTLITNAVALVMDRDFIWQEL